MAKTGGFGICISNKDLKKAMAAIEIDYDLEREIMEKYYSQLLESHLLIIVCDSQKNQYVTTLQQIFNWEYKMWTRWKNNEYQRKKRGKDSTADSEKEQIDEISTGVIDKTLIASPKEILADDDWCSGDVEEFFG